MFTGLIEEIGIIDSMRSVGHGQHVGIRATRVLDDIRLGDSIAVDGVCLTVVGFDTHQFVADAVHETVKRTNLSRRRIGDGVNIERALAVGDRLGGHFVSGHVDGIGRVERIEPDGMATLVTIGASAKDLRYMVEKGSIAIDGISLTIADLNQRSFTVSVIPHTFQHTTLAVRRVGDEVNLECDVLAKYVERVIGGRSDGRSSITLDVLRENGFA